MGASKLRPKTIYPPWQKERYLPTSNRVPAMCRSLLVGHKESSAGLVQSSTTCSIEARIRSKWKPMQKRSTSTSGSLCRKFPARARQDSASLESSRLERTGGGGLVPPPSFFFFLTPQNPLKMPGKGKRGKRKTS